MLSDTNWPIDNLPDIGSTQSDRMQGEILLNKDIEESVTELPPEEDPNNPLPLVVDLVERGSSCCPLCF